MKIVLYFTIFFLIILSNTLCSQNLILYDLELFENNTKDSIAFISLSDNYILSEHPDSLAIPNIEEKEEKDAQYLKLDSLYRKRFLSKMNISETDSVFIYDYSTSILIPIPINNLNVVACLNIYGAEWPYKQSDFMIGFEINRNFLKNSDKYFVNSLAYIGKKSPFVTGQLKPIIWKKIETKNFPLNRISPEETSKLQKYQCEIGNAYAYNTDSLQYLIQEFVIKNDVLVRCLLVIRINTAKIVCERIYYDHESASPAPLNSNEPYSEINQWTGKLFKNKPIVIFGFEYISFGCPEITFLDPLEKDVYISCDNRH